MFRKPMRLEKWIAFDGSEVNADPDSSVAGGAVGLLESDQIGQEETSDSSSQPEFSRLSDDSFAVPMFLTEALPAAASENILHLFPPGTDDSGLAATLTFPIGLERPDHFDSGSLASWFPRIKSPCWSGNARL